MHFLGFKSSLNRASLHGLPCVPALHALEEAIRAGLTQHFHQPNGAAKSREDAMQRGWVRKFEGPSP